MTPDGPGIQFGLLPDELLRRIMFGRVPRNGSGSLPAPLRGTLCETPAAILKAIILIDGVMGRVGGNLQRIGPDASNNSTAGVDCDCLL